MQNPGNYEKHHHRGWAEEQIVVYAGDDQAGQVALATARDKRKESSVGEQDPDSANESYDVDCAESQGRGCGRLQANSNGGVGKAKSLKSR
jgi:hypothetical protein